GHEMATAALPGFLRSIGAPAAALGAIEGVADGALSFSKLGGGVLADQPGVERRAVAAGGYAVTALAHGTFGLLAAWPLVALARAVSWIARGGKAPARDALLAGSVSEDQFGRAFGVERAMDSAGAVVGPLLAAPLIVAVGYRWLFAISVIPGLLAALSVLLLVREAPRVAREAATALHPMRTLLATPGAFRRLLVGLGLFGAGLFSTTLLILRATDLLHRHGRSLDQAAAIAVLLYALHNAANAVAAYPAGTLADRLGRRQVLVGGMTVFAISCVLFAITPASIAVLAALFGLVGISRALVETGQGSYAAELLPDDIRGRGFGLIGLVDGLGDLIANVVVGVLFSVATPAAGFFFAAVMSSAGAAILVRPPRVIT
ncbi:MAG: MFS transporter, partial [Actinomycetota bacterium]|nr:MFS transporter [Actinomycetota bacterium]